MRFESGSFGVRPSRTYTNNLRLIKLAVELQQCSRQHSRLHSSPSIRVTRRALEESYFQEDLATSQDAARKMAQRDLQYMEETFSLSGAEKSGFYMGQTFPRFKNMFEHWLDRLDPKPKTDARLNIMLEGLIRSIENGMRADPIVVSDLASALKEKYGKKNIRDTKQPLYELFCDNTISNYLMLSELEQDLENDLDGDGAVTDRIIVLHQYDPILLRLRSRSEVGENDDISINLALPGRIRSIFEKHCSHLDDNAQRKLCDIANAVSESHCWRDEQGQHFVPYLLFKEGGDGEFYLTLWSWSSGEFTDIRFDQIVSTPSGEARPFVPYGVPEKFWNSFKRLSG